MVFNGVTVYLADQCRERESWYQERYLQERAGIGRSLLFVKRHFYDEMAYKLAGLVDWEADSFAAYLDRVRKLVPVRKAYVLRNERDPESQVLLREAEEEFRAFLDGVTEADTAEPDGYYRVIQGEERERLEYAILEKWDYDTRYWYPLNGGFDESKLFLNGDYFEPYRDRLCKMLGLPEQRIYEFGESYFDDGQCCEVDDLYGYGGNEVAYLPKDLSWVIYFSHENTVTFAGSILPQVRELLENEREHWNSWD